MLDLVAFSKTKTFPEQNTSFQKAQKEMDWNPWLMYKVSQFGKKILRGADQAGEKLADGLGITSPKYEYEINQYKKQLLQKEREDKIEKENTWTIQESPPNEPITKPPAQTVNPQV